jgi:hypothetical protein
MIQSSVLVLVTLLSMFGISDRALAGVREDILDRAARCAQFADDRQWLDCYYGSAQPMRARLGLPPAQDAQVRLSVSDSTDGSPAHSVVIGGINAPASGNIARSVQGNSTSARITAFSFDSNHIFTVTLSNGQIWRQLSGDTTIARWTRSPNEFTYNANISGGALGSTNLTVAGLTGSYKIERLR